MVLLFRDLCFEIKKEAKVGIPADVIESQLNDCMSNHKNLDLKGLFDNALLQNLKNTYEGKCCKDGLVLNDSIRILERTNITFPTESLRLHYTVTVCWSMTVCCPPMESVIECSVLSKNKIGIMCSLKNADVPILVLVPNDLTSTNEEKKKLIDAKQGDVITMRVLRTKFEQGHKKIIAIAKPEIP